MGFSYGVFNGDFMCVFYTGILKGTLHGNLKGILNGDLKHKKLMGIHNDFFEVGILNGEFNWVYCMGIL